MNTGVGSVLPAIETIPGRLDWSIKLLGISIIALLLLGVPALFATRLRVVGAGSNVVDGGPSPAMKRC